MLVRLAPALALACAPVANIEVQGVTVRGLEEPASVVPEARVIALDGEGEEVARTTSDERGVFRVSVPEGSRIYLVVGNDEDVPASYSGVTGFNPRLRIPNGQIRILGGPEWELEKQIWSGCPDLDVGGWAVGTVLVDGLFEEETGDPLQVTTAHVEVLANDGRTLEACYLDEEGQYAPGRTETGSSARFLVPAVPPGVHTIQVTWRPIGQNTLTEQYVLHVPESGVAPRFPLFVRFDP